MACRFQPNGPYPPEAYVGVMNTIGLDVGVTAGGVMAWGVFAPTAGPMYGGLAGTYVGASGSIGVGVGVVTTEGDGVGVPAWLGVTVAAGVELLATGVVGVHPTSSSTGSSRRR